MDMDRRTLLPQELAIGPFDDADPSNKFKLGDLCKSEYVGSAVGIIVGVPMSDLSNPFYRVFWGIDGLVDGVYKVSHLSLVQHG